MIKDTYCEELERRICVLEAEVIKHKCAELKFASFFDLNPDPMAIIDMATWNFIDANRAYANCTGYSREELIGVLARDFHLWINYEDLAKMSGSSAPLGTVSGIEVMIRQRSGNLLNVFFSARIVEIGQQRCLLLFGKDITESKRVEETLYSNEEKYRTILEDIDEGYFENNLDGTFTFVSDVQAACLGCDKEELIGLNYRHFCDKETAKKINDLYKRVYQTGEPFKGFEAEFIGRDGKKRISEFSGALMRDKDGKPIGFRGVSRNITERIKSQEALRFSEERHRAILKNIQETYFESDLQGHITFINEMASKHLGYAKEELLGKKSKFLYDEAGWQKTLEAYKKLYRTGEPFKLLEAELISKDGKRGIYELSVDIIRNARGVPTGFRGVSRDITERKRLTERLNRAEKMEALGTMAGGVAHDLNNVLGVLVGYSESLAQSLPENSIERQDAETIMQAGWRCTAIVDDLLTLARRGVHVSEVTDLNKMIFDYLRTPEFEQLSSYHPAVKIITDIEEDLAKIKGSPVHLNKAIMNLVSNAMEAIPDAGKITIRTENRYLEAPLRGYDEMKEGDYVVLTISDTGAGISAKDLDKIFEPFYTKKVMGRSGTGLGLAVVWGAVKDHNGFIDVQSEEGKGTSFNLYFPVTGEKAEKAREAVSPERYKSNGESILVVDDVKEQRELAIRMLGQLGYRVDAVPGGEEAIEYLKNKKADLIVLDMVMDPGISGMETYQKILEMNPGQKAVMVSGFSENDQVTKAREMGAGAFVRKPYILEKIGLAVRQELDQKRLNYFAGGDAR